MPLRRMSCILCPKANIPSSDKEPWYDRVPVGKNTLGSFVKIMCQKAGIENRSNHSLCATGTTCLFNAGVPEKIIQKTTGHHSLSALRDYERVSSEQHQAVSRVLMNGSNYEKELSGSTDEKELKCTPESRSSVRNPLNLGMASGLFKDCYFGNFN